MSKDVLLENKPLFNSLVSVIKKGAVSYKQLVEEMNEDGVTMDVKRLQRFVTHGIEKRITQKAYLWLLARHGINLSISVSGSLQASDETRLKAKKIVNDLE